MDKYDPIDPPYRIMRCFVVNKYKSQYDVNIQRGTMWGNPYKLEDYGNDRDKVIELFNADFVNKIKAGIITIDMLRPLRRQRLGCTCSDPTKCHGNIIARVVNKIFKD